MGTPLGPEMGTPLGPGIGNPLGDFNGWALEMDTGPVLALEPL
jgi:hypothetical protein